MDPDGRYLGLRGYDPLHLRAPADLDDDQRRRLGALRGSTLTTCWSVWDLDEDSWFTDAPVVLDFGGPRLEVAAFQTHILFSWDSIDLGDPIVWFEGSDFRLAWRKHEPSAMSSLYGSPLAFVALLLYRGEPNGFAFETEGGTYGELFNALDELGVRQRPEDDPEIELVDLGY